MDNCVLDMQQQFTHPVRTAVTEDSYYAMIRRAKIDGLADASGYVNVDSIFRALIDSYGSGDYVILPPKRKTISFSQIVYNIYKCSYSRKEEGRLKTTTKRFKAVSEEQALDLFTNEFKLPRDKCKCKLVQEVENDGESDKSGS